MRSNLKGNAIFHLLSLLILSYLGIEYCHGDSSCKPVHCRRGGPEIRFPFRLKDRQPQRCGYSPGFDLSCQGEETVIHMPFSGQEVLVKDIDYKEQMLVIADPKDCLWGLLFHNNNYNNYLNSSSSPFRYNYSTLKMTLLKCSKNSDESSGFPIACMSDFQHKVLAVLAYNDVGSLPISCKPIKTIETPMLDLYIGRAGMPVFGCHICENAMLLEWEVSGCSGCERMGGECGFKNQSSSDTMCFYHYQKGSRRNNLIIGASIGSFLLLAMIMTSIKVFYSWKLNRKLDLESQIKVEKFLEDYKSLKPTRYSYADLKKMTNQFKEKLGQGGYGCVFKGKLPNETHVAVKILKTIGGEGEEFINEVGTIGKIHHVNVVRLLGFCADRLKRGLIYEFMPNESLEKFIFSTNTNDHFLSWEKLQDIAIGVARGIEYLHQGCNQRILHFDIKPHNILLDQNFNPKISDFGLAKLCSKGQSAVSMTAARGTMGYIAPEVFSRNFGNVSYKSDVYSFGMLLLEMVGGRKNIDVTVENTSQVYFPEWIYERLHQGDEMGLNFATDEEEKMAKKLTIVALWCIQWCPMDRPPMQSVVQMLEGNMESLMLPADPFASTTPTKTGVEKTKITNLPSISE